MSRAELRNFGYERASDCYRKRQNDCRLTLNLVPRANLTDVYTNCSLTKEAKQVLWLRPLSSTTWCRRLRHVRGDASDFTTHF